MSEFLQFWFTAGKGLICWSIKKKIILKFNTGNLNYPKFNFSNWTSVVSWFISWDLSLFRDKNVRQLTYMWTLTHLEILTCPLKGCFRAWNCVAFKLKALRWPQSYFYTWVSNTFVHKLVCALITSKEELVEEYLFVVRYTVKGQPLADLDWLWFIKYSACSRKHRRPTRKGLTRSLFVASIWKHLFPKQGSSRSAVLHFPLVIPGESLLRLGWKGEPASNNGPYKEQLGFSIWHFPLKLLISHGFCCV